MCNYHFHLPYDRNLADLVETIASVAPGASGFETGEILLVVDNVCFAETIIPAFDCEIIRSRDRTPSMSTQIWVSDRPGLESDVASAAAQLWTDIDAYRVIHIEADQRHFEAIQKVFAGY